MAGTDTTELELQTRAQIDAADNENKEPAVDETDKSDDSPADQKQGRDKNGKKKKKAKKKMKKLIHQIAESCDDHDGFDIYQWNAYAAWVYADQYKDKFVQGQNEAHREKQKQEGVPEEEQEDLIKPISGLDYSYFILQALTTFFLQTAGMIILFWRVVDEGSNNKEWCSMDGAIDGKLVVFAFSLYIGFTVNGYVLSITSSGMYAFFEIVNDKKFKKAGRSIWENVPFFISTTWVHIGYFTNLFALFTALFLSYFIIFYSESVLDVILNSVAMFFLLEIDDLMLTDTQYEQIEAFINSLKQDGEKKIDVPEAYHQLGNSKEPICGCVCVGARLCVEVMSLVSRIALFTVPIATAVCY